VFSRAGRRLPSQVLPFPECQRGLERGGGGGRGGGGPGRSPRQLRNWSGRWGKVLLCPWTRFGAYGAIKGLLDENWLRGGQRSS